MTPAASVLPFLTRPRLAALAVLLTLLQPSLASAATLNVPSQYTTIQAAVNAAASGDTVLVAAGTYQGASIDGKNLTIVSQAGAGNTIIGGQDGDGGLAIFSGSTGPVVAVIKGLTIQNSAGSGIYITYGTSSGYGPSVTLTDCIFTNNNGGGIYNEGGALTVTNSIVINNTAEYGGGGIFNNGSIMMTDCTIAGNNDASDGFGGGGILNNGSIMMTDCTIAGNNAAGDGGGIYNCFAAFGATLTDCIITGNTAGSSGGGVYNEEQIALTNCTISGNTSEYGGGVYNDYGNESCQLTNDIIYGDTGGEIAKDAPSTTDAVASYCDVQGGYSGTNNIDKDPQFVNAAYGDLHLKSGSPCIRAGIATGAPTTDLDGNPRPNPPSMGAYDTNAAANPALPPVLLVHGTNSSAVDAWSSGMSKRLAAEGFTVEAVNFPTEPETLSNETYIELQAKAIGRRVQELEDRTGQRHIDMVCHSMGGLAARYYLEHLDLWPVHLDQSRQAGVDKLILLGTPNWGLDSTILDPVATVTLEHYKVLPLAADGYDTSAVDTYDNWSPAIKEMFAEWEPAPISDGNGSYAYPNGYNLWSWPTNFITGSYETPIQADSYLFAQAIQAARFVVYPVGSDYLDITGVLDEFPSTPYSNSTNVTHLNYYTQTAQSLGVMYPDGASVAGVDGRLVSPFLKELNTTPDNSGAQIYMIAGTRPIAIKEGPITVYGPFNTAMLNDGVVPMESALGQDPITGAYLYPQATRAVVGEGHIYLPGNPYVIDRVVAWLEDKPNTNKTHLLWDNPDGKAAFWNVDAAGNPTVAAVYGPYTDGSSLWHATALATGPDGVSHLLWNNPDGHVALWTVQTDGSITGVAGFGPYPDGVANNLWRASGVSVGPDNVLHLLWTNPDGGSALWNVGLDGTPSVLAGYGPFTEGSSLWAAVGVSTGPDNVSHLLWANPDGKAAFWNVSDADGSVSGVTGYGPYLDGSALWAATGVSTGPDNVSHLLWDNADGKAAFWSLGASGSPAAITGYGPYTDTGGGLWSATALATGPDSVSRLLWDNPDGKAALWGLDGSGNPASVYGYGPYTDGAASNLWSAVGLSAGP